MKITVFRLDEKFLWWTTNSSTIAVVLRPDNDGYEVFVTVNNNCIKKTIDHYDSEEYAMLAYRATADIVRGLAKASDDLDEFMRRLLACIASKSHYDANLKLC